MQRYNCDYSFGTIKKGIVNFNGKSQVLQRTSRHGTKGSSLTSKYFKIDAITQSFWNELNYNEKPIFARF